MRESMNFQIRVVIHFHTSTEPEEVDRPELLPRDQRLDADFEIHLREELARRFLP